MAKPPETVSLTSRRHIRDTTSSVHMTILEARITNPTTVDANPLQAQRPGKR